MNRSRTGLLAGWLFVLGLIVAAGGGAGWGWVNGKRSSGFAHLAREADNAPPTWFFAAVGVAGGVMIVVALILALVLFVTSPQNE